MNRVLKSMVIGIMLVSMSLLAQDVTISISNSGDDFIDVYMSNTAAVGGFQFTLTDTPEAFTVSGASGGSAGAAGFMMSTNADGLVLGFSLTGATIPVGDGLLCTVALSAMGDFTDVGMDNPIFSDATGSSLSVELVGFPYSWGTPPMDPPEVAILSPAEGDLIYNQDIDVSLSSAHLVEGDQFHVYLDGSLAGMYSTTDFTLTGIAYGAHELMVTVADVDHNEYTNPEATDSVNFENAEQTLEGYTLSMGDGNVLAGESVDVDMSLANEDIVGGFQLQLIDFPNYAEVTAVNTTDRTDGFMVSMNEQPDGSVLIVGFDMSLVGVAAGTGPILTVTYHSTGIYDSEIDLSFDTDNSILSDLIGNPLDFTTENGMLTVDGETPPDVFPPADLTAVGGWQMVNLSWTHPEPWTVVAYYIYRDGVQVGESQLPNYADTGLDTNVEYCYTVVAASEFNVSEPSNEACATTMEAFFDPPQNLVADEDGLQISLNWAPPASVNACGNEMITGLPFSGTGSNVGESDDWPVQGSQGADYAYMINISEDTVIDITLCTASTDYDTKLEVFTADADCNATSTGYYDDDATCQYSGLYSSLYGVALTAGQYYIVVDGFAGQTGNFGIEVTESGRTAEEPPFVEDSMALETAKSGIGYSLENWTVADFANPRNMREFLGYEVYRDNQMLEFTTDNFYVDTDPDLWYLITYCYNITAVYDEGTSGFSNTACATPQLGAPTNLTATGEGDGVALAWEAHPDNAQTSFYIYRDGEFLTETTETTYNDNTTTHDVEYCYTVTAYYEGIGESPATNEACSMWSLCPPSYLDAAPGDGYIDVTWDETSCGEEVYLQYSGDVLANAFYFYATYEDGYAHGTRFDVGTDFDVISASVYILSEGDQYWPWPNDTHGPVRVMIFADDGTGLPGELLFDEETTAVDGWATVNPNITGLTGSFFVVTSHTDDWSVGGDPEGFGIDDAVDYPDNMVTMQGGTWSTGDVLFYGGDYMTSALINAYGQVQPLSYGNLPSNPFSDFDAVAGTQGLPSNGFGQQIAPPYYHNEANRELLSYDLFKDGVFLTTLDPDVFAYHDEDVVNMQEYCYHMTANYTEGTSEPTDDVCAIPIPGNPPLNLTAEDMAGTIHLDWDEPLPFDGPVLNYNVYRDGEFYDASAASEYDDTEPVAGVTYCYTVTAVYASGESFASNEACSVYVLDPPVGVIAEGLNDQQAILVTWNAPGTEGSGETIEDPLFVTGLPFEDSRNTNDYMDDYDEACPYTGSTSPDVVYMWAASEGDYHIDICDSDYDTKIYVYDENQSVIGCVDDSCNAPDGSPFRSDLNVSITSAGTYYIIVDGYGGAAGTYNLLVEEGFLIADREPQPAKDVKADLVLGSERVQRPRITRELTGYNVYRDGVLYAELDNETFEYLDEYPEADHDTQYCYTVRAVYDDGLSIDSNEACAQWVLPAPSGLTAVAVESTIELNWTAAGGDVIEYSIYRDGTFFDSTTETNFVDTTPEHDVLYCYEVRAVHDLGESAPTNEACTMWMILPPMALVAEAGPPNVDPNAVHLSWIEPGQDLCADETIPSLPFSGTGTNVGMGDDWPVQGSQGADYAYGIYLAVPTTIDITLCDPATDYDTKLEVFTADFDCNATTTGYYDDDFTCEFSVLQSTLQGVALDAGQYYIVVDGFGGGEGNFGITVTEANGVAQEPMPVEDLVALESAKLGYDISIEDWQIADGSQNNNERPLIGYNIYRDGSLIDSVDPGVLTYDDTGLDNCADYCYTVRANFDEGESPDSNESCATPLPGSPPTDLHAQGENDYIALSWTEPEYTAGEVINYIIYRDGVELATTTDTSYQDSATEHDVEYCYEVTAVYSADESCSIDDIACDMWELCPPSHVEATPGDRAVDVSWEETACGEEVGLQYDDGVLANAFYFYDTYENGYAHGMRFDVGTNFDVLSASLYILSEGDQYWPWPNSTHGPVRVMIFDDNNGLPGDLLYDEEATAVDGWATVEPNLTGLSGAFHVVASHTEDWSVGGDPEGFGIDGSVDYPDNMVTMQNGTWSTGDVLFYGGDYMMAALVNARGGIQAMSYGDLPSYPATDFSMVASIPTDLLTVANNNESHPDYINDVTRELLGYNLYRDDVMIAEMLAPDVYTYHDADLENWVEYCYTMEAIYGEGPSQMTDPACATTFPGDPPTDLSASAMLGQIHLDWVEPAGDVIEYIVYRDGEFYDSSTSNSYDDSGTDPGVTYCYTVSAMFDGGESEQSNESCAMWDVDAPTSVSAVGLDGQQAIQVAWMPPGSEAFLTIEILTDTFGGETSWDLVSESGEMIEQMTGGLSSNTFYTWDVVLQPGTYTFTIYDAYGDGICCAYGEGYYNLILNETLIATGGEFGTQESVTFSTSDALLSISQSWYEIDNPYEKGTELTPEMIAEIPVGDPLVIYQAEVSRDLLNYLVYRDGELLATVGPDVLEYLDEYPSAENDTEYCYYVVADYDEGTSDPSNTACAQWHLSPPTNLVAEASGSAIQLTWDSAGSADLLEYAIYKDGEFFTSTTETSYLDADVIHDVEYCYYITGIYEIGESAPTDTECTMWQLCPPGYLATDPGDGYIDLTWDEVSCGEEVYLQYDDGVLANAFYFYDTYENGYAHGMRFDVGTDFDVLEASVYILSEGDQYWPWPNETHGPVTVMIFDDDNGLPGNLLYSEEATAVDGWATVTPDITGLSGAFHVVTSHAEDWSVSGDPEGFGIDGAVDHPDNMVTMQGGVWSTGDVLFYGGDYMMAALINAYGQVQPLSFGDLPSNPFTDMSVVASIPEGIDGGAPSQETHPPFYVDNMLNRALLSYELYRDDALIATLTPDVFSYHDDGLANGIEHCYTMTATYDEGVSPATEPVCDSPGVQPTNLVAIPGADNISLTWEGAPDAIEFVIYRDGSEIDRTTEHAYDDNDSAPGTEYCYTVTANYSAGESMPTNEACTQWDLNGVMAWIENEGYQSLQLSWTEPGVAGGGDTIEDPFFVTGVPFDDSGSTVDFTDDYDEVCPYSGSTSPDVVYMWNAQPGNYHVDICDSDYDTKIYVYDENMTVLGCVDDSCNAPDGSPFRSDLNLEIVESSTVYIIIDGYGGAAGNYNMSIDEGFLVSDDNTPQPVKEDIIPMSGGNSHMTDNEAPQTRSLTGFLITRDGEPIDVVEPDVYTYVDTDLINGQEYCYTVTAQYDEGDADVSNEACGTPFSNYQEPENFQVDIVDGVPYAHMLWTIPGGSGQDGFNIYRDGTLLAQVGSDVFEYDDADVVFWQDYCWQVAAFYGEFESDLTTPICGAVPDPGDFSVLSIDDGSVVSGGTVTLGINLENQFNVAGFQFTLAAAPGLLTIDTLVTTPRTPEADGWAVQYNEQPDGSIIVVGFNLLGGFIEVGTGAILEVTYTADMVLQTTDVALSFSDAYLGDEGGNPLPMFAQGSIVTIIPAGAVDLFVGSTSMAPEGTGSIDISMTNDDPVGGLQFMLTFDPAIAHLTDVQTTDRTADWMLSGSPDTGTIIGFSLMGTPIEPGEGPIMIVNLQATGVGDADLCLADIILSDQEGQQMPAAMTCGLLSISEGPVDITQDVLLQAFRNNMFSFNVVPEDFTAATVFGDNLFIAQDDGGHFYVPSFGIDQIGDLEIVNGYKGFINGSEDITLSVTGPAADVLQPITWSPFMNNLFAYLPQESMPSTEAFDGYADDILILSNDSGEFIVPSLGVNTMATVTPGEGYQVFINGVDPVEYYYPVPVGLAHSAQESMIRDFVSASESEYYDIVETGNPYAIIIVAADGAIDVGDELVAYDNGTVVGATKVVDLNQPITIAAWGSIHDYNVDVQGFEIGDEIDLRLYDASTGTELRVDADLDAYHYGVAPFSSGTITVRDMAAVPTEYTLSQNYPNPFNPSTTIEFSLPGDANVTLKIYDIMGRQVRTLIAGQLTGGYHAVTWDGTDGNGMQVSAGMYIYALQGEDVSITRKMVMMK